jgi:hypothetical protein
MLHGGRISYFTGLLCRNRERPAHAGASFARRMIDRSVFNIIHFFFSFFLFQTNRPLPVISAGACLLAYFYNVSSFQ